MEYLLMDLERTLLSGSPCFWNQNKHGYTYEIDNAGVFSQEIAEEIVKHDLDQRTVLVPKKLLFDLALKVLT